MTRATDFWARRRAGVQAEALAEAQAEADAQADARTQALAEKEDCDILRELGLPDPQSLEAGDDFAAFLQKDVPEHLRRVALRKLWRSNPVLACVDGLNEYDDDYRAAMLLQGPVQTAYQVGKGMLKHVEEMTRQAEAKADEAIEDEVDPSDAQVASASPATETPDAALTDTPLEARCDDVADDDNASPLPARRMRFRFEEASA